MDGVDGGGSGSEHRDASSQRVFAWSEYRRTAYPGSPGTGRRRRRRPGVGAAVPLPGHARAGGAVAGGGAAVRSEEHTSELQSLMRISYAAFCLKKTLKHRPSATSTTVNH